MKTPNLLMIDCNRDRSLAPHPRTRSFPEKNESVRAMKPPASPLMGLLWTAMLVLPAFGAAAGAVLTTLHSFQGKPDGANPQATLVQGNDGYFYGTTASGGANGYGTVFKISAQGAYTSLYSFTGSNDGGNPVAGLVKGNDGYFYGTTRAGGTNGGHGTVFRIATNGALTSLHSFADGNDGGRPAAALVQGGDGYFYGTTAYGTVFKITTNGVLTGLYSFTLADGGTSEAALVLGADGDFYGTTAYGLMFKITTNGAFTRLAFDTNANGGGPPGMWLAGDSDGYFYGTTGNASHGAGTVFKMSSTGALTNLFTFNWYDGNYPAAAPVEGTDGYLYGTTQSGGTNGGYGTVFKISTNGAFSSLYSFTGTNDGALPEASLVQGADGSFYGTTSGGGQAGLGTVFRLTILPEFQAVALTNGALNLTWSVESGGTYQLQYNSNLSSSNWINVGGAVIATGATLSATDAITNGPQRFYRVMLLP